MSLPYINRQVKCAFRWYSSAAQRTRHLDHCKDSANATDPCPYAIVFNNAEILPFQLIAGSGTLADSYPTTWGVYGLDGGLVLNLNDKIPNLNLQGFTNPVRNYLTLEEPLTHGVTLDDGLYEMKVGTPGGDYFSETFRVCGSPEQVESCMHTLSWTSCGDVGSQRYTGLDFVNIMYLESEKFFIGKPTPVFKLESDEDSNGEDVDILARKDVRWNMEAIPLPWYTVDALTEIPLHSSVSLRMANTEGIDTISNVLVDTNWPDGSTCEARLNMSFYADESSFRTGCCESFSVACTESCIEADGIFGIHTPELTDVFLLDGRNYGTYVGEESPDNRENGFGFLTACPSGFATTTIEGYENVYWTGSEWFPAVYILDVIGGECDGTLIVTGNMMGQFGGIVQYSENGADWIDTGSSFTSSQLGSGVEVDVPVSASSVRVKMIGDDCTVGYSPIAINPCGCCGGAMRFNTTHPLPSGFDGKKNGEDGWVLQIGTRNGRRFWNFNDGTLGEIQWNGTAWIISDTSDFGMGLIAPTDTENPCEITEWFETTDFVSAGVLTDATMCGGGVI